MYKKSIAVKLASAPTVIDATVATEVPETIYFGDRVHVQTENVEIYAQKVTVDSYGNPRLKVDVWVDRDAGFDTNQLVDSLKGLGRKVPRQQAVYIQTYNDRDVLKDVLQVVKAEEEKHGKHGKTGD